MPPHPRDWQTRPTAEQIRSLQEEAGVQGKEVLSHIYQAILK